MPSPTRASGAALAAVLLAACHTTSRITETRPGPERSVVDPTRARALPATVVVSDDGHLRFVQPLRCAADVFVEIESFDEVTVAPNLATVVIGIIVTAASAVTIASSLGEDGPAASRLVAAGGVGVAGGLTLAIAPWFGTGRHDEPRPPVSHRKRATEEPCGDRPVAVRHATVRLASGARVWGAVAPDGTFAVSTFGFVDAFAVGDQPALDLTVDAVGDAGPVRFAAVIDAAQLAPTRGAFLAGAGIDARAEPLRKVPRLEPGALAVSLVMVDGIPHLQVALPLTNAGPGDAWQVRAAVSSDEPELDGRIVYVGHVGAGATTVAELAVPLSPDADRALGGDDLELHLQLRDAHGTAPERAVTFRGRVLAAVPR